jgi:hypothetical protein
MQEDNGEVSVVVEPHDRGEFGAASLQVTYF